MRCTSCMFSNNVDFKSKSQLSRQESERRRINFQQFFWGEVALRLPVLLTSWGMEVVLKQVLKKETWVLEPGVFQNIFNENLYHF